jgi:hypothetical protein
MMHLVPSCPSPNYFSPAYSPESPPELNFEFDLNLLPSSDCADVVAELDLPLPLSADPFQVSIFLMLKKLFLQPHPYFLSFIFTTLNWVFFVCITHK